MGKVLLNCSFILLLLAACLAPVIAKGYANKVQYYLLCYKQHIYQNTDKTCCCAHGREQVL